MLTEKDIATQLRALLSKREYQAIFQKRNEFRRTKPLIRKDGKTIFEAEEIATPDSVSSRAAKSICEHRMLLLNRSKIIELSGPVDLYRFHDGQSEIYVEYDLKKREEVEKKTSGTLGSCWVDLVVMRRIWNALTKKYRGDERKKQFVEFLRSANFIDRKWTSMKQIAWMHVPHDCSIAVVRGPGNWRAMQTSTDIRLMNESMRIKTPEDLERVAGMMALPGEPQCIVPLFSPSWVREITMDSPEWPLRD